MVVDWVVELAGLGGYCGDLWHWKLRGFSEGLWLVDDCDSGSGLNGDSGWKDGSSEDCDSGS